MIKQIFTVSDGSCPVIYILKEREACPSMRDTEKICELRGKPETRDHELLQLRHSGTDRLLTPE